MKTITLSLLFLALITIPVFAHEGDDEEGRPCVHDKVDHDATFGDLDEAMPSDNDEEGGRMLAAASKMRIYPFYGAFVGPASYKAYIQNELVPPVIDYFTGALKVKYPVTTKITVSSSTKSICGKTVPSVLRTGVTADYFLFLDSTFDSVGSWVAESTYCSLATGSKRPFISKTLFNRNMIQDANGDVLVQERNTYLLIHELIHTFGFSRGLYPYFLDDKGKQRTGHIKSVVMNGKTRTVLDVPALTTKLRNFFGCSSLEGAYMENDGGSATAGSHFERRHYVYDTMTSGVIHGRRISQFSLGVLEASGWYDVDYNYAEPYFFGQGQGCNFLKLACTSSSFKFDEFCKTSSSTRGCAPHGRGGGKCMADSKSDGCKYYYPSANWDCENSDADSYARLPGIQTFGRGAGSRCFEGTLSSTKTVTQTNFCFKFTCNGSGSSTTLTVNVGSKAITCKKEGSVAVAGYNGAIKCPDPLTFCNTVGKKYCPRGCMGRGTCRNNVCVCNKGYKGVDCGLSA